MAHHPFGDTPDKYVRKPGPTVGTHHNQVCFLRCRLVANRLKGNASPDLEVEQDRRPLSEDEMCVWTVLGFVRERFGFVAARKRPPAGRPRVQPVSYC